MFSVPSQDWCKSCFGSPHLPRNGVWRADLRALPVCLITRHERFGRLLLKRKNKKSVACRGAAFQMLWTEDDEEYKPLTWRLYSLVWRIMSKRCASCGSNLGWPTSHVETCWHGNWVVKILFHCTLKNKGSLLAWLVLWKTLDIHGTLQIKKMFFIVEKGSLDLLNALKLVILGTVHWKVILGIKNGSSIALLPKYPFGTLIF